MSDDDYRLQKRIQKIRESQNLTQHCKQFILNEYLTYQKRAGAQAESTQERYLRRLKKILQQKQLTIQQIQGMDENQIKDLNKELVDEIQNSEFKQKPGELSVRNKRGYWNVWTRLLETLGYSTEPRKAFMPNQVKFSSEASEIQNRVDTTPDDLPTPNQMKQFLNTLKTVSSDDTGLRNQALMLLIWDTGARAEEALNIKMKQVSVNNDRLKIMLKGNKTSSDRRVEIFQGRKTIVDYIETHAKRSDPEAYLFPPSKNNQHHDENSRFYTFTSRSPVRRKIHQARRKAELGFKTRNEPFHIFRKAMTTYYVVNDILSWEKVCERQGKSPDGTMPTYLKMAMQDIDATAAEGFGLDNEAREMDHRMKAHPLLPQECSSCEIVNRCYVDTCQSCGVELPESSMPKGETFEKKEAEIDRVTKLAKYIEQNPEVVGDILDEH